MGDVPMPRLSLAAREAIFHSLSRRSKSAAVPISRILGDIRAHAPSLLETDEELIEQIVIDATDAGYAVHFDQETE